MASDGICVKRCCSCTAENHEDATNCDVCDDTHFCTEEELTGEAKHDECGLCTERGTLHRACWNNRCNGMICQKCIENTGKMTVDLGAQMGFGNSGNSHIQPRCPFCRSGLLENLPSPNLNVAPVVEPEGQIGWNCLVCTFANDHSMSKCEICNSDSPNLNVAPIVEPEGQIGWNCLVCTFTNDHSMLKCEICATDRP